MAEEIARLLDRAARRSAIATTGVRRPIGPGDIGVLFRTRESHSLFEAALARRGVPYYVYKGLGFFDAEEVKDVLALRRVSSPIPDRTSAPPRSCARASSSCPMRR